jgi:predicted nucleic acid-binding protein
LRSFLLDTNVVSEWVKPHPNPHVVAWLQEVEEERVFLSVASLAEIRRGVEIMPAGKRRDRLAIWLSEDLPARFAGRILDIDSRVADSWGIVMARGQSMGTNIHVLDAFFAATAQVHGLTLVTRNVQHFLPLEVPLLDPWEPAGRDLEK